jgi:hypothetical protein
VDLVGQDGKSVKKAIVRRLTAIEAALEFDLGVQSNIWRLFLGFLTLPHE